MATPVEPTFPEEAYGVLVNQVYRPFFFEKLARDWNVVPANRDEEEQLLNIAAMLRQQKEAEVQRTGGNAFLAEACDALATAVASQGGPAVPTSYDNLVKRAAVTTLQDQQVREAVEQVGAYLGQCAQLAG